MDQFLPRVTICSVVLVTVNLSVCQSVTLVDYAHTVWVWPKIMIMITAAQDVVWSSSRRSTNSAGLAYLNSYTGCPLSGTLSSRSPALPTKPYLLASLPTSIHPWNIPFHFVPSVRLHDSKLLFVPRVRACFGSRSFAVAAPTIWNSLPLAIRSSVSTHSFRGQLKTYFYNLAFRPS